MYEGDLTELDDTALLDASAEFGAVSDHADTRLLEAALVFADRNHEPYRPATGEILPGMERIKVYGGDGCPGVAEFAPVEFGARNRMSATAAASFIGEALALRHRLPRVWARVLAGEAQPWRARRIAHACLTASRHAAAIVDAEVESIVNTVTGYRLRRIVQAAVWQADPAAAQRAAEEMLRARGVWLGQSDQYGTKQIWAKLAAGDAIRLDACLQELAEALAVLGDTDSIDRRRAKAVGWLTDPEAAAELRAEARRIRATRARTGAARDGAAGGGAGGGGASAGGAGDSEPTGEPDPVDEPYRMDEPDPTDEPDLIGLPAPADIADPIDWPDPISEPDLVDGPMDEPDSIGRPDLADIADLIDWPHPMSEPDLVDGPMDEPNPIGWPDLADIADLIDWPDPTSEPDPADQPHRGDVDRGRDPGTDTPSADTPNHTDHTDGSYGTDGTGADADPGNHAGARGGGGRDGRGDGRGDGGRGVAGGGGGGAAGGAGSEQPFRRADGLNQRLADIKARARTRSPHTVYVHLTDLTLATGHGVLRVEDLGPLLASQLAELLGHDKVVLKPVIDLNDQISVDAYEIPHRLRERVKLRHPVSVFPWSSHETTTRTDLDHIVPYDDTGPPTQTSTDNLAPLGRFQHRLKTFGGWIGRRLPGAMEWTSPRGAMYRVDHIGTHYLGQTTERRTGMDPAA